MRHIKTVGIVGTGVIGAGWSARCLARGLDVIATDPGPDAADKLRQSVDNAWPALEKMGLDPDADRARLKFSDDLEAVCDQADFIQESAPENEALKRELHAGMDALAAPEVIIASSSSGLLPSRIQVDCRHPQRIVIGHPFNPVYLLPLVEVVPGDQTAGEAVDAAGDFYCTLGMHPLKLRAEIDGYISDRLQEALWRESLHLVADGVATTGEIDDAIAYGPGLRWAFMGTCLTFHLAGGDAGMRHMLEHFGPALELPWTKLKAPELTNALIDRMVEGTQAQAAGRSVKELERLRDDCLIGIMRTLRRHRIASGKTLAEDEARRYGERDFARWTPGSEIARPLALYECAVDPTWVDYNGHMGESFYLYAFGDASDALFRYIGIDEAYRAAGNSFYTVESHINYYHEVSTGEPLKFTTQFLGLDEKRLHFLHTMYHGRSDELLAATEQMLLHVDMKASSACPTKPQVHEALSAIMNAHKDMHIPPQVGRQMKITAKAR
ncbi:MAG: L-carnitine dehydrogenase [Gammaproteobacteria bacterium]